MIRSLIRKELRALRPFIFLLAFLLVANVALIAFTEFPDAYGISNWDDGIGLESDLIVYFILAFSLAQGLLMRERSEDTLEFLDALPVTRHHVFWVKVLTAYLVLAFMVIADNGTWFLFHLWSRESHTPELYPHFWWPQLVILLWMNFVYLCIGLAASRLGRFGIFGVLLGLVAVLFLRIRGEAIADLIDPFAPGELSLDGTRVVLPWKVLNYQMGIGLICLWLAYRGFLRLQMPQGAPGFFRRAATPVFIICCAAVALLLGAGWFSFVAGTGGDSGETAEEEIEPFYLNAPHTRMRNDDFVFIYPNNEAKKSEQLIADSTQINAIVTDFLGTEPRKNLVIDLTSKAPRHAGTAYWKKARINLDAGDTPEELAAIFGHELTHIYIDQMSDNRLGERFNSTRFFHEGLASYIEFHFFRKPEDLKDIRRLAAAAHDREDLRFETIVDSGALSSRYTSEWVYPLGEAFVAAVIERFGEEAPQNLIRAFSREDAPQGLQSMTLWQDTFQACGYNLEEAIGAFFALLEREASETQKDWLATVPRLRGELMRDDDRDRIGVRIVRQDDDSETGKVEKVDHRRLLCRFRPSATTSDNEYRVEKADKNGVVWVDADYFKRGGFWYQIGYLEKDLMMPVFSRWVRGQLTR